MLMGVVYHAIVAPMAYIPMSSLRMNLTLSNHGDCQWTHAILLSRHPKHNMLRR